MTWAFLNANTCAGAHESSLSSFSQKNKATSNEASSPESNPRPLVSHLEIESVIPLPPTPKTHSSPSLGFHSLEGKAICEFRKGQSPQILKHRLEWKGPDAFAQYYFRDLLF